MGKRKIFVKSDLATAQTEHVRDLAGHREVALDALPPPTTVVAFGRNAMKYRHFDFAPWYGVGIDEITYACQRQVERFLDKQDADVEASTVGGYCYGGLKHFLAYAAVRAAAQLRPLRLADITRATVDGYLLFLRDKGNSPASRRTIYSYTKSILQALGRRGFIALIPSGDETTFPKNPFPNVSREPRGEQPLTTAQRKAFTVAVKTAVQPLFTDDSEPSGPLLAYALLVVALHTGRNTTPLLEMPTDCLRPHPKDGTEFLVLYKRRGHSTTKVALRAHSTVDRVVESTPTLRPTVAQLIHRVIDLTRTLRNAAPADIRDRVWVYRSQYPDSYLREHFKHWSMDMTLGYALNEAQETALYAEIQGELDDVKAGVVDTWLNPDVALAGGYGRNITSWRTQAVTIFKDHRQMVRALADSTAIRSNGHAWCTADDNLCVGNDIERTRCSDCNNAVIGPQHAPLYEGLYDHLKEARDCDDIGEGGLNMVRRDMDRCRRVLVALGQEDPEGRAA